MEKLLSLLQPRMDSRVEYERDRLKSCRRDDNRALRVAACQGTISEVKWLREVGLTIDDATTHRESFKCRDKDDNGCGKKRGTSPTAYEEALLHGHTQIVALFDQWRIEDSVKN